MIVTVAWVDESAEPVEGTGRPDLGVAPEWRRVTVPRAVVWVLEGDEADVESARAFASRIQGAEVFTYPASETDPLARARADVIGEARKGRGRVLPGN